MPCVSPCGARIGLAEQRIGGNRESRSGRFAWDCLCNVSLALPALSRHVESAALTVQLVAVQMLCAGVALSTALVRALELLVEALSAAPSLPRGAMAVALSIASVAVSVSVASTATGVATIWRCGGWRLVCSACSRVHLVSELRLDLA